MIAFIQMITSQIHGLSSLLYSFLYLYRQFYLNLHSNVSAWLSVSVGGCPGTIITIDVVSDPVMASRF